ncbi:oligopeptide ABC transporter permease [Pontibacillus litoralis]|uniref:Peptide ABC transporter permease n=1 Tax=Pontibacillus litoralis JSM 072002 TaxID=1385512 RepID=A0A0A5G898_9BACI|nr:oligopeptide ABC transporter permease [Pontibacillus litoralis]KGX87340.1 peptide ABC transporter permease [Pontibacillus litoralis JSM 072002]
MLKYTIRRILAIVPMLFLISVVVFFLALAMPGDALSGEIDPNNSDPEYIEMMREKLGYNDPIHVQYYRWITDFIQGDFGTSVKYKMPVEDLIAQRLPNTIFLGIISLLFTYLFAFAMGMYAGKKPYTKIDHAIGGFNYLMLAIPIYIAGVFAIYLFSFKLGWFPFSGSVDIALTEGTAEWWLSRLYHVILPALVLGAMGTASYTQFLRNDIIDNSQKDYVRTARAKGTPESRIYNQHILRNSVIPLITFLGFDIVTIVNGALITETIFTYPGLGQLFLTSMQTNDYPTLMTLALMFSFLVLIGNLIADLLYGIVDPRIRVE